MKSPQRTTVVEASILAGLLLFIVVGLLFPVQSGPSNGAHSRAKNDVTQIATAVMAFETEYGYLPATNDGEVGGEFLLTLLGTSNAINPRKVVFLEVDPAGKRKSGLTNGRFVDPWGGVYQIAFDSDYDGRVKAGTNGEVIKKRVAVWNVPDSGEAPPWWSKADKQRRYVTSW